jgi:hypothetical protein
MKNLAFTTIFTAALAGLAACAGLQPPAPGASTAAVEASLGQPTAIYRSGGDTILEYAKGPAGQFTWMARMGPDDKLKSFEQVLTAEKLATIQLRKDTKETVLHTFGRPAERLHFVSVDGDVWAYRYKEQLAWNSMMYVEFDRKGVVQALVNGPDPDYEERRGR